MKFVGRLRPSWRVCHFPKRTIMASDDSSATTYRYSRISGGPRAVSLLPSRRGTMGRHCFLLDAQPFVMANLGNFAVLVLKAKVDLPSISSVQIDRQRSRLARLVLTGSYRGIALSGSNTTLPSIIRLRPRIQFGLSNDLGLHFG
jgi:hypothetical protein